MTTHQQPDTEQARHLPLGLLAPSPTNPRKRFDPTRLAELAESVKKHGVMQPILARPNPAHNDGNGQPPFEIVAGERRWRASQLAGRTSVLALIRDLGDIEALELQLLENMDRDDLHPLEEADGLHALMQTAKLTPEAVAAKVGKSLRWVFLRLALRNLCQSAREAFLAGEINASVAGLIARMPSQQQQAKATDRILTGFGGEPFTFRAAADYLRKEFMLDLANASFDIHAAYTVAGPCSDCDKRSGAAPDLFDDVKSGDLCQDSTCFNAKGQEAHEQLLAQCRKAGHQVLQGDAAKRLMPGGPNAVPTGYFRADQPCAALTADKRTLFDVFGDTQKGFVTVEHPGSQALVTLVPETIARKALAAKKLLRPPAPAPQAAATAAKAQAEDHDETAPAPAPAAAPTPAKAAKPVPLDPKQLQAAIDTRAGELFSLSLFLRLCAELRKAEQPPLVILRCRVADDLIDASHQGLQLVRQMFPDMPDDNNARRQWLATLNGRELADLMAIAAIAEELSNGDNLGELQFYSSTALPLAQEFNVNVIEQQQHVDELAEREVRESEDRRLGKVSAGDAFAASQQEAADA